MKSLLYIFCAFLMSSCIQPNENRNTTAASADSTAEKNIDTVSHPETKSDDSIPKNLNTTKADARKKDPDENYFTLLSSLSEDWVSGIPGGGTGTDYFFKVKINTDEKLKFDSAWINSHRFVLYATKETKSGNIQLTSYAKEDIITLRISDKQAGQNNGVTNTPPLKYTGAALMGFTVNGKRNYYVIKEIKKLKEVGRK